MGKVLLRIENSLQGDIITDARETTLHEYMKYGSLFKVNSEKISGVMSGYILVDENDFSFEGIVRDKDSDVDRLVVGTFGYGESRKPVCEEVKSVWNTFGICMHRFNGTDEEEPFKFWGLSNGTERVYGTMHQVLPFPEQSKVNATFAIDLKDVTQDEKLISDTTRRIVSFKNAMRSCPYSSSIYEGISDKDFQRESANTLFLQCLRTPGKGRLSARFGYEKHLKLSNDVIHSIGPQGTFPADNLLNHGKDGSMNARMEESFNRQWPKVEGAKRKHLAREIRVGDKKDS